MHKWKLNKRLLLEEEKILIGENAILDEKIAGLESHMAKVGAERQIQVEFANHKIIELESSIAATKSNLKSILEKGNNLSKDKLELNEIFLKLESHITRIESTYSMATSTH